MSATTCAAVVSCPCPWGVVPSVTTISPKMSSLTVATSLLPENWSSGLISRDWPKLFVPESRVEPMPAPSSLPRARSEEHTSELQSPMYLVCRLLLEKKKQINDIYNKVL